MVMVKIIAISPLSRSHQDLFTLPTGIHSRPTAGPAFSPALHRLLHLYRFRFRLHAAEECKNPQRDLPRGIIATLVICTLLYIGVVVVLTGSRQMETLLDNAAPSSIPSETPHLQSPAHRPHWRAHGLL